MRETALRVDKNNQFLRPNILQMLPHRRRIAIAKRWGWTWPRNDTAPAPQIRICDDFLQEKEGFRECRRQSISGVELFAAL